MAITKNIVSDYGAAGDGVSDDGPEFCLNLNTDLQGQDCTLIVPAGSYLFNSYGGGSRNPFTGSTSLTMTATGAALLEGASASPTLGVYSIAQKGIDETTGNANAWPRWPTTGGHSARILSVSAGANSVTLDAVSSAAGHISRAVVGAWMLVSGFDTQGLFQGAYGYPPNGHFYDYVQITAVDTTNKIIAFTPALTESYSALWPEFNRGSANEPDSGGPATVYFMHPDWGTTIDITGGTYKNANLIGCSGKDFTIRGANHSLGGLPVFPTMNKYWRGYSLDTSGAGIMELDKYAENITLDGGTHTGFHTQNSSLKNVAISNLTVNANVNGTGRRTTIDNCVIGGNLTVGCDGYGSAETFVCRNTSVAGSILGTTTRDNGISGEGIQSAWSMADGLITIPMSYNSSLGRMFVPDPYGRNVLIFKSNSGRVIDTFQVLSVTGDRWPAADNQTSTTNVTTVDTSKTVTVSANLFTAADIGKVILIPGGSVATTNLKTHITGVSAFSGGAQDITVYAAASRSQSAVSQTIQWGTCNMYVRTNKSGGLPDSSLYIGGGSGVLICDIPPVRTATFENVTGSATALDLSQSAARNRPLWSYTKRTFDGTEKTNTYPDINIYGTVVSIKINVLTAYTGVRPTLNVGFTQFDNMSVVTNGALVTYAPRINLKQTGERIITPSGVTGAWAGANPDTGLSLGGTTILPNIYAPRVSQDITGESASVYPSYTIEIITDQGFYTGPTAVTPLRLRLRAA